MNRYCFNEGELAIPASWTDQTLNIFKLPATATAKEASFIVSRDRGQGEGDFSDYIARQLAQCEKSLPGYRLLHRHD